jgi:hypothetical protein
MASPDEVKEIKGAIEKIGSLGKNPRKQTMSYLQNKQS